LIATDAAGRDDKKREKKYSREEDFPRMDRVPIIRRFMCWSSTVYYRFSMITAVMPTIQR
jgi:hypothetical protein